VETESLPELYFDMFIDSMTIGYDSVEGDITAEQVET
jgi:hypothetical protein